MPLQLGGAIPPRQVVVWEEPAPPTVEDLRTEQMLTALAALREALDNMAAPVINVAEPDLTAIVQAVTQLNGPASADDIAAAVVGAIGGDPTPDIEPVLADLAKALKQLDFRLQGLASTTGGVSGPSSIDISDRTERHLGRVVISNSEIEIANDVGNPVPVSGTVAVSNFPAGSLEATQAAVRAVLEQRLPKSALQYVLGYYRNAGDSFTVASGQTGVLSIENPAASGKILTVTDFLLTCSATSVVRFRMNGTVNAPTILTPWLPNGAVASTINTRGARGATGVTGGTVLNTALALQSDAPFARDFTATLLPGQSIQALVTATGLTTATFTGSSTWIEEPLS